MVIPHTSQAGIFPVSITMQYVRESFWDGFFFLISVVTRFDFIRDRGLLASNLMVSFYKE